MKKKTVIGISAGVAGVALLVFFVARSKAKNSSALLSDIAHGPVANIGVTVPSSTTTVSNISLGPIAPDNTILWFPPLISPSIAGPDSSSVDVA